jgi:hypothetical protein
LSDACSKHVPFGGLVPTHGGKQGNTIDRVRTAAAQQISGWVARVEAGLHKVLQQPWLVELAEELWARNISYAERFDQEMLQDMRTALHVIPEELRIGATGFCTLATISDLSSGYNHKHIDSNDVTSCFVTLGIGVEGGSTVYFNGRTADDAGDEIHKVGLQHGQYQTGAFHEVLHATDAWEGPRATLSFFLRREMLKHFVTYGDRYYTEHRLRMYYLGATDADELPHGDGTYVYTDGRVARSTGAASGNSSSQRRAACRTGTSCCGTTSFDF